jgi:hypothetical protein
MRFIYVLLCCLPAIGLSAQPRVTGAVHNQQGEPIAYATANLLNSNDSTFIVYTSTNTDGRYQLTPPEAGTYLVQIRCLGYVTQTKSVTIAGKSPVTVDFELHDNPIVLNAVTVKARNSGMFVRPDTISYNPKAFIDGSEEVLGDVLKKLPGIEVSDEGDIRAHGKQVSKIMLNGKDFFEGSTHMPSKNLPAGIAEKVEVINHYNDNSLLQNFQSSDQTVINIGVNKDWMGKISGNISAGGGVREKYTGRGFLMQLNPKLMTSIIGTANNTGGEVFNMNDYIRMQGGVAAYTDNNNGQTTVQLSDEEQMLLVPSQYVRSRRAGLAALNIAYQPKDALKINSYILFHTAKQLAEQSSQTTYFIPDSTEYTHLSNFQNEKKNYLFNAYLRIDYKPAGKFNLSYRATASNMNRDEQSTEFIRQLPAQVTGTGGKTGHSFKSYQKLLLMQSVGKHLLTADMEFKYDNRPASYCFQSDSLLLPVPLFPEAGWYYGRQAEAYARTSAAIELAFRYKINERYFFKTALRAGTTRQTYRSDIYQNSPGAPEYLFPDDTLNNRINYNMNDYNAQLLFVKNRGFLQFKAGAVGHRYEYSRTASAGGHETRYKIQPQMELSVYFSTQHYFVLSYTEQDTPISAQEFLDGTVIRNFRSYSQHSNMTDMYVTENKFAWTYVWIDVFWNTSLNMMGNYRRLNNITTVSYRETGLQEKTQIIPAQPKDELFIQALWDKGLSFIPWKIQLLSLFMYSNYNTRINGFENTGYSTNSRAKLQFSSNYKKLFNAEFSAGVEYLQSNASLSITHTWQLIQRYGGKLKFTYGKNFRSSIGLEYIVNASSDFRREIYNLSGAAYYRFFKTKMEVGIECNNILNINNQEWANIFSGGYYTSEVHLSQLPGNILLRLNFRF